MIIVPLVRSFMTTDLVTTTPDTSVTKAISIMLHHKISGLPVIEDQEHDHDHPKLIGLITEKDCLKDIINHSFYGLEADQSLVRDYMTTDLRTVTPTTSFYNVATLLLKNIYRRVPVVDNYNNLMGIVSRHDILKASRFIREVDSPQLKEYLSDEIKAKLM